MSSIRRTRFAISIGATAAAVLVGTALLGAPAFAADGPGVEVVAQPAAKQPLGLQLVPTDDAPDPSSTMNPPPDIDMTNVNLVANGDETTKCLFRNGVYPAGGVGYADSSLPYDGYPPLDRAILTYRAELLRAYPDQVAGIEWITPGDATAGVRVSLQQGTEIVSKIDSIDEWGSAPLIEAHDALVAAGAPITVTADAVSNVLASCSIQDAITDDHLLVGALPSDYAFSSWTDPLTGQLAIQIYGPYVDTMKALLAKYGDAVVVTGMPGLITMGVGPGRDS